MQTTNLNNAKENLKTNSKELDIMKDFSTTTEVSRFSGLWTYLKVVYMLD